MMKHNIILLAFLACFSTLFAQQSSAVVENVGTKNAMIRVNGDYNYVLLPIEEIAPESQFRLLCDTKLEQTFNVRLAQDHVDYYMPIDLTLYKGHKIVLDIIEPVRNTNIGREPQWKNEVRLTDVFETKNYEKWRPKFHHTPTYAWMNDPNGMFYDDTTGTWHLYFQWGPYGSTWNNMTWRHSSSKDLINWTDEGVAIAPNALGTIFSGSCVVDKNNTAGFGAGAVIALYTADGMNQRQCLAYSTDGGKTFTNYDGNPILSAAIPDFRDPNMFWNDEINAWNLILAAGQEMRIYSSPNLIDWKEESRFGLGYGNHKGVWECPDLMKVDVLDAKGNKTGRAKWVLVCNINPGGPFGGSATQYFVGEFDGHRFVCEDDAFDTKWMDYGKDHYATVSFSNAPDNRKVVMAWMSNWQYADRVPTTQFRSSNSIARDLFLYETEDGTFVGCRPSKEYDNGVLNEYLKGADQTIKVTGSGTWTVSNTKGESVAIVYDAVAMTLSVVRSQTSGKVAFATEFPAVTTAPVYRPLTSIRVISDNASVEVFGNNGEVCLTNLVFPSAPLTKITKATAKSSK